MKEESLVVKSRAQGQAHASRPVTDGSCALTSRRIGRPLS